MPKPTSFTSVVCLLLLVLVWPVAAQTPTPSAPLPESTPEAALDPLQVELLLPEVVSTRPHDTSAWTEGLLLVDGYLYESVGETGKSDVRKLDPLTGEILQRYKMGSADYAEGLALVDDRFIQLTYQQEIAYIYDRDTLQPLDETFTYQGEGWGLAYDGEYLWMSNGSGALAKRDPHTFALVEELPVTLQGLPIESVRARGRSLGEINELEVVGDTIYANVWPTTYMLRIDKPTGYVTGIIDGSGLLPADAPIEANAREYLNGIAYDAGADTFLITGKYWPYLFEVTWKVVGVLPEL